MNRSGITMAQLIEAVRSYRHTYRRRVQADGRWQCDVCRRFVLRGRYRWATWSREAPCAVCVCEDCYAHASGVVKVAS